MSHILDSQFKVEHTVSEQKKEDLKYHLRKQHCPKKSFSGSVALFHVENVNKWMENLLCILGSPALGPLVSLELLQISPVMKHYYLYGKWSLIGLQRVLAKQKTPSQAFTVTKIKVLDGCVKQSKSTTIIKTPIKRISVGRIVFIHPVQFQRCV